VKNTGSPDKIGLVITSERLIHGPLYLPIQQYKDPDATATEMLRNIAKINQYPGRNLNGAPFTLEVTTVCCASLHEDIAKGGAIGQSGLSGSKARRTVDPSTEHAFHDGGLIKIYNKDNYCLFYACELARQRKVKTPDQFYKYCRNTKARKKDIRTLMMKLGIPMDQTTYDARLILPQIQQLWDVEYPKMYRFYVYERYGRYRPAMKTGSLENKHPLALFFDDRRDHFDVIDSMPVFLGGVNTNYCYECETPYR
jgi:hypothetical protein